jgi:drug/metabolite transporter (DMT)-like permease
MKYSLIALSYAFCWGVGLTLAKIALTEISPTTLLIIQLISSVLFLYTICYFQERKLPLGIKSLKQGVAGIFEPALAYMFGTLGLELTTAVNASLIGSTEVIITIFSATIFLRERLASVKIVLASISFLGVFLLMGQDATGTLRNALFGDLLVLVGTTFAVAYVILSKLQVHRVSAISLTASQQFVGLITTAIAFGILSLFNRNYEINAFGISPQFWLLAIISGIMQYALGFLLYLIALRQVDVSHAAFYVALIPAFGVASAIFLIGEQPNLLQWFGAGLIVTSSYFANRLRVS